MVDERLQIIVEETVDRAQFGFRKIKGTRNEILALGTIIERSIEKKKDLFWCFVDFEKAFDTVCHEVLVERLRTLGVDPADIRLMTYLYWGQRAVMRIENDNNDWIKIERGVRQGCVLSPDLYIFALLTGRHE